MRYLFIGICLIICYSVNPNLYAQNRLYGGFALGNTAIPDDQSYSVNQKTFQIPILRLDVDYSSVGIPVIMFETDDPEVRWELGFNGISNLYDERPERVLSADKREVTSYEVSITTFYTDYMTSQLFFNTLRGHLFAGLTVVETVLTEAKEVYQTVDGEDDFKGVSKTYGLDYGLGATFGLGISYQFFDGYELAAQVRHFYRQTGLTLPDGTEINAGSTQFQMLFLIIFD